MMKSLSKIISISLLALIWISCSDSKGYGPNQFSWGQRDLYRDFLWKHYDATDTTHYFIKKLAFDFNEEALREGAVGNIVFELVEKQLDAEGIPTEEFAPTHKFIMFKNGQKTPDNKLTINPSNSEDTEVEISLQYNTGNMEAFESDDVAHMLRLRVIENGGLDRIGDIDVSKTPVILEDEWVLEQHYVWNPLQTIVIWTAIILFIAIILICIICRANNPKIRTALMMIEPTSKSIIKKSDGVRKVILTSSKKAKSRTKSNLFTGKSKVVVDPVFVDDIILTHAKKGIRVNTSKHVIDPPTKTLNAQTGGEFHFTSRTDETKQFTLRTQ